jgi:ssDNA-binding Zn-finger/Zn-ribbon topoisomerase 1
MSQTEIHPEDLYIKQEQIRLHLIDCGFIAISNSKYHRLLPLLRPVGIFNKKAITGYEYRSGLEYRIYIFIGNARPSIKDFFRVLIIYDSKLVYYHNEDLSEKICLETIEAYKSLVTKRHICPRCGSLLVIRKNHGGSYIWKCIAKCNHKKESLHQLQIFSVVPTEFLPGVIHSKNQMRGFLNKKTY